MENMPKRKSAKNALETKTIFENLFILPSFVNNKLFYILSTRKHEGFKWYAENSSKTTRRMQLVENNSSKIKGGKLVEN